NSAGARHHLIANLRQSAFFWTGFSTEDVQGSRKNAITYLEKEDTGASTADRHLLAEVVKAADMVLASSGWQNLSDSHELGLFVHQWPAETAHHWTLPGCTHPMLTGMSQALEAQRHVHERVSSGDPSDGLAGVGIKSLARAQQGRAYDAGLMDKQFNELAKAGLPSSSIQGEPSLKRRRSMSEDGRRGSPKKRRPSASVAPQLSATTQSALQDASTRHETETTEVASGTYSFTGPSVVSVLDGANLAASVHLASDRKSPVDQFPNHTPFEKTQITGTSSAKLSYLVSQILIYYQEEKILVFYDGDNAAFYIAQMLDLLHIRHEIYAKSLTAAMKSEYVVNFNEDPEQRVLLMDVKQAAHGLNISSASRVYFVNPVCRPNIEAQAIKRAHRIGQTRRVHVETLVLEGTIEEKMHERAKRMTGIEHRGASYLEDDGGMRDIIQSAKVLPISAEEMEGLGQMAALEVAQQMWGRPGWEESLMNTTRANSSKKRKKTAPVKW
ncbi:hypothetical protein LTR95_007039, partial [Oleoguttula sp. CCFEE 5521]